MSPDEARFEPPSDPVFQYLMEAAADGHVLVYAVEAPLSHYRRYSPTWGPQHSPDGARAMKAVMAQIGEGKVGRPFVYPRDKRLIVSDDYFLLACMEMLQVPLLRAWHLGVPEESLGAHGPLAVGKVRELIAAPAGIVDLR